MGRRLASRGGRGSTASFAPPGRCDPLGLRDTAERAQLLTSSLVEQLMVAKPERPACFIVERLGAGAGPALEGAGAFDAALAELGAGDDGAAAGEGDELLRYANGKLRELLQPLTEAIFAARPEELGEYVVGYLSGANADGAARLSAMREQVQTRTRPDADEPEKTAAACAKEAAEEKSGAGGMTAAEIRAAALSAQRAYVAVAASEAGVDGAEVPRSGREAYIALYRVYNLLTAEA